MFPKWVAGTNGCVRYGLRSLFKIDTGKWSSRKKGAVSIKVHRWPLSVYEKLINTKVSFIRASSCHYSYITSKAGGKDGYWTSICKILLRLASRLDVIDTHARSSSNDSKCIHTKHNYFHHSHIHTLIVHKMNMLFPAGISKCRTGSRCSLKRIWQLCLCKTILSMSAHGSMKLK